MDLTYPLLLTRFFTLLRTQHPDLTGDGRRSYKIPPPQVLREGNKKTIFANISDICKRMKRQDEHVTQFLFAELGTSGSVDGSKRLVIRGKFQQKQLENVLRRYIREFPSSYPSTTLSGTNRRTVEYVTCRTCKSPDTDLKKGENRLFFVTCNSCGSRRSVAYVFILLHCYLACSTNISKSQCHQDWFPGHRWKEAKTTSLGYSRYSKFKSYFTMFYFNYFFLSFFRCRGMEKGDRFDPYIVATEWWGFLFFYCGFFFCGS